MSGKYRYRFFDLMAGAMEFPSDANALVVRKVRALKSDVLLRTLEKAEKLRAYGQISVFDNRNAPVCTIEIHSGVVKSYNLIDNPERTEIYLPLRIVFLRSYRNDAWSFKKNLKGEDDEQKEKI